MLGILHHFHSSLSSDQICFMENHLVSQKRYPDPQASARDDHMKESRTLRYQLKSESTNVPHADIRSGMVNDANIFPSISSVEKQDIGIERQNEEVVRYMSNLPSFLKKNVKMDEKAFSVGVLDWKLLEKWQHFHNIGNQHASAPSNISSFSSAQQKLQYRTLQSHFYGTPFEEAGVSSSLMNNSKANIKGRSSCSSSRNPIGTFGAEEAGVSSSTSSFNISKANSKGRSSPLRRLLEPLMRPAKSSEGYGKSSAHLVKVKLDLKTCEKVEAEVPHGSSKNASSTVQALLQVAVRNGFPLFTFAVDNKNDILAATRRNSISGKEEFSCIYSFFVIQELKKKSGNWINSGRKDKGNDFVPNIVAQMKVTDSFKQKSRDQSISKEYVLFPSNAKQAETSAHEPNDELAAVVVNIPNKSTRSLSSFKCNSGSGMTVLLPSGHHGQPIKGESSSLIKRWQSGGSCDCGGWDLGCRMRVLTDNAQSGQTSTSAHKLLELFSQDEGHDQKPVFSLAPFKDGIYAVEFNSSIEILQAFSISLSILSCLNLVECVETSNKLEGKSSAVKSVSETGGKRIHAKPQTVVPAFVSNPPHSPVGRV